MERAENKTYVRKTNATLSDTENLIIELINKYSYQVNDLAIELKGDTDENTAFNIWVWVRKNIEYVPDRENIEEVRRPLRTITEKKGDCDCTTVLVCSLLKENNIIPYAKIVAYPEKDEITGAYKKNILGHYISGRYAHIYSFIKYKNKNIYIDTVPEITEFNTEYQPITNEKIINIMELHELAGTDNNINYNDIIIDDDIIIDGIDEDITQEIQVEGLDEYDDIIGTEPYNQATPDEQISLLGIDDEEEVDFQEIVFGSNVVLSGSDLTEKELQYKYILLVVLNLQAQLNTTEKEELNIIENILNSNIDNVETALKDAINETFEYHEFYNELLENYEISEDTEKVYTSEQIINADERATERIINGVNFHKRRRQGRNRQELMRECINDNAFLDGRRRRKKKKKKNWRDRLKLPKFKKPIIPKGKGKIKKIIFKPARGAFLVLVRLNVAGMGKKLAYGSMTSAVAKKNGLTTQAHSKFKESTLNFYKKWTDIGGDKDSLQKAIKNGRTKKAVELNGVGSVTAIIASSVAVATPVIAFFNKIFKSTRGLMPKKRDIDKNRDDNNDNNDNNDNTNNTNNTKGKWWQKGVDFVKDKVTGGGGSSKGGSSKGGSSKGGSSKGGSSTTPANRNNLPAKVNEEISFFKKNKTVLIGSSALFFVIVIVIIVFAVPSKELNGTTERKKRKPTKKKKTPTKKKKNTPTKKKKTTPTKRRKTSLSGTKKKTTPTKKKKTTPTKKKKTTPTKRRKTSLSAVKRKPVKKRKTTKKRK